jgi:hypothetical protein
MATTKKKPAKKKAAKKKTAPKAKAKAKKPAKKKPAPKVKAKVEKPKRKAAPKPKAKAPAKKAAPKKKPAPKKPAQKKATKMTQDKKEDNKAKAEPKSVSSKVEEVTTSYEEVLPPKHLFIPAGGPRMDTIKNEGVRSGGKLYRKFVDAKALVGGDVCSVLKVDARACGVAFEEVGSGLECHGTIKVEFIEAFGTDWAPLR